jgi:hypothetical protein
VRSSAKIARRDAARFRPGAVAPRVCEILARGYACHHGLSGCGKTTRHRRCRTQTPAWPRALKQHHRDRVRIFVRRPKRPERLVDLARDILAAGRVVDAFLRRSALVVPAAQLGIPFVIVAFEASEATLRERIVRRQASGGDASDADLAVLEHQIAVREPLSPDEKAFTIVYDAEARLEAARASDAWARLANRLVG